MVLIIVGLLLLQRYFAQKAKSAAYGERLLMEGLTKFKDQKITLDELKSILAKYLTEGELPEATKRQKIQTELESFAKIYNLPELETLTY